MGLKIQGGERRLADVFGKDYVFEIPPYQRPYSWTTEQAEELLDDLLRASRECDPNDPDPYFLGSVVLAKEEGVPDAKVIDGQQRLTTLTVLLAVLAERLPDGAELRPYIMQQAGKFSGTKAVTRLTLRPKDAPFFREYVQQTGGIDVLVSLDPAQLHNDAQRNLRANAMLYVERLAAESGSVVEGLAAYLLQHCFLIVVSTPDSDSAFQIFAVLNDRGLDLTFSDILKNELIGAISDDAGQEAATKAWEDAEEALGREVFGDLFSHLRMIYAKSKQRHTLRREFREHVKPHIEDQRAFIDDVVVPYADHLAILVERSWQSTHHAADINRAISWLQRLDNFDWMPPAMRMLEDHHGDAAAIRELFWQLERLAASMFVRRRGINPRIDRYTRVLEAIDRGDDLLEAGSPLDLTDEEKAETLAKLDGELYLLSRPVKYVLLRLDSILSSGEATYDHRTISVEHVLPQSPRANSVWLQHFDDEARERWTHRLANLVLLDRRKNSQASNYDFEEKKIKYFATDDKTSPFPLTTQVLSQSVWTPAVLEERQQLLLGKLANAWDLSPAAE
jgi:hypothetical protein